MNLPSTLLPYREELLAHFSRQKIISGRKLGKTQMTLMIFRQVLKNLHPELTEEQLDSLVPLGTTEIQQHPCTPGRSEP